MSRFGRRGLIIEWYEAKAVTSRHLKYVIYLRFSCCIRESAFFFGKIKLVLLCFFRCVILMRDD